MPTPNEKLKEVYAQLTQAKLAWMEEITAIICYQPEVPMEHKVRLAECLNMYRTAIALFRPDKPIVFRVYLFQRADGWYPIELPDTENIEDHVKSNPGTLKVCDAISGEQVWPKT